MSAWRRSGLKLAEFARQHEIGLSKLSWWKRRLEAADGGVALAPMITMTRPVGVVVRIGEVEIEVRDAELVTAQWLALLVTELAARTRA